MDGGPNQSRAAPHQDDTPLFDVTFVVLDLETTGLSPTWSAISEIGALKLRGGEQLGSFQTLVNPGEPIPPAITNLTGITEYMVGPAPGIGQVLPSLVEFIGAAVMVGHNVRFDLSFLEVALATTSRPSLSTAVSTQGPMTVIDTCKLSRRLLADEVLNCRLSTLAHYFSLANQPTHRALDDAAATGDLMHALLERLGTIGITSLGKLLDFLSMATRRRKRVLDPSLVAA